MLYRGVGKKRLSFGARALIVAVSIFVAGGAFVLYAHWAVSASQLETNVRVEELSELKYYLVVKEDGVDKFGVQSTDDALAQIQSDTIEIRDRLPDGLEFLGFEPSPNGTLVAVERSNSNVTCRGAVVDDTQETNVDSGTWNDAHTEYYYHGLHYSEDTRTVTFSVKDLQAGCNLTVGISTRVPALNGASRMDFYNTAQTKEDDREEDSNTVHVWIGADETVTHRVSYNYTGDIPDSAPSLPRDANYSTGAPVSVALEPNLDGYGFSGWTSSDVTITNGSFSMPDGDVVLTGSFTRLPDVQKYEVSYAVTGDVPDDYIVPKTREYAPGETVAVDSTEAGTEIDHRIFSGWTTNDATITDGAFEMPDAPVVITGSFELQRFNLSYEFTGNELPENAAELLPAAQEYPYGAPVTIADAPSAEGFTFSGWSINRLATMPAEDVVIYGSWYSNRQDVSGYFAPEITTAVKDKKDFEQGDTVEIEVYVKNTAEFTITNVRIDEGLDGATFLPGEGYELLDDSFAEIASIAPGETVTLKLQYKVTENKDAEYTQIAELVGAIASVPNYELDPNGNYIAQDNFVTKKKLTPAGVIDDITEAINPVTADNLKHALWLLPFCAATITLVIYRAIHKKRGTNRRAKRVLGATLAVTGMLGIYQFGNAVFAEPSEAVDSIALESQDGYSQASPGSWKINKSARWTSNGTAEIKLQLDTRTKPDTTGKDVIFVMDSGSNGAEEEFRLMTSAVSSVAVSMRTDGNNRTALILDSQPYQIISDFSDSQTSSKIHNLDFNPVMINFYQGLEGVENMLRDYTLRDGRELIVVLISARRPDREHEYQASQYRLLKRLYPYITIHTIAFGDDPKTTPSMANITDRHFEATAENLKEQVLAATVSTRTYSELLIEDSIADDFELDENVGIEAALGNAEIVSDGNSHKIVWDLSGAVRAGLDNPQLTIGVKLKEGASRNYYATNNYLSVDSKILGVEDESRATTESPVLKANYRVHYDANAPSQCTAENVPADEYYHPYSIAAISEQRPTCEGYRFAGYVPVEGNFTQLNDDYIRILESDVTIRALWLRNSMEKHMDGEVHMINTLYNAVAKQSMSLAKAGNKYNTDENNNFTNAANMSEEETNLGANTMASTVNDEFPVHYFHGNVQSNSVLFAGFCWRIVRTTETGGVKLLYNGLYEDEKKCEVNRGIPFEHNGYWTVAKHTRTLMDFGTSMYYYAPSYQYSLYSATTGRMTTTTRLSLAGGLVAARMNTAGASLEGMYTCKNYKNPSECEEMYYIDEYVSGGQAYVYKMTWHKIRYTNIGATKSTYDNSPDSMSAAFYMQGDDEFPYKQMPGQKQDLLTTSQFIVMNSPRLNTTYWYADSVEYDPESGTYSLVDPYQVSSADEYSQLVGKYTFSNISSAYTNRQVYYLYYRPDDANYADAINLTGGKTGDDIDDSLTVGDGVIENSDSTFTLTNPQHITMRDWLSGGYVDYEKKILCEGSSEICDTPHYIDSARRTNYTSVYAGTKFAIAKDMHDYVLEDPLILYTAELFGPRHNYYEDGYKYICIGAESPCPSENIRLATSFFNAGTTPSTYHDIRFAESVEWDGEKYQLKNTVGLEYLFDDEMRSTHRYTCLDARTSCEEVYLYYALKRSIALHGGVTTLSQARDIMMGDTKDSLMKIMVDEWFEENMLDDLDKIEDTVYCGDRTAALLNSWGTDEEYQYNGGNDFDYYDSYVRLGINRAPSLECNERDSYTVSPEIGNGKLTYPVALLSADELVLAGQRVPRGSFISPMQHYAKYTASMSPYQLNTARYYYADDVTQYSPQNEAGVSPAISLRPDTLVVGGDGSGSNPYVLAWPDD